MHRRQMKSKESPEIQVSSAKEIRARAEKRNKTRLIKLSTGLVIEIGNPQPEELISNGYLPADLVMHAIKASKEGKEVSSEGKLPEYIAMVNSVVKAIVVNPKIVDQEPKENEILVSDLSLEEKTEIFNEWSKGGENLKKFRSKKQGNFEKPRPNLPQVSGNKA
jgi:hypothetical protein